MNSSGVMFNDVFPFTCQSCNLCFDLERDQVFRFKYPIHLVNKPFGSYARYLMLQNNGVVSYALLESASLSTEPNRLNLQFSDLIKSQMARGLPLLDVGCGPQAMPVYLIGINESLIGLDPLASSFAGNFIQGSAENIPLATCSVGTVTCATSIDHFFSLRHALQEIHRVLVPGGRLIIWDHVDTAQRVVVRKTLRHSVKRFLSRVINFPLRFTRFFVYDNGVVIRLPEGSKDPYHNSLSHSKSWQTNLHAELKKANFHSILVTDKDGMSVWEKT